MKNDICLRLHLPNTVTRYNQTIVIVLQEKNVELKKVGGSNFWTWGSDQWFSTLYCIIFFSDFPALQQPL